MVVCSLARAIVLFRVLNAYLKMFLFEFLFILFSFVYGLSCFGGFLFLLQVVLQLPALSIKFPFYCTRKLKFPFL